jgi:hypothetical protein
LQCAPTQHLCISVRIPESDMEFVTRSIARSHCWTCVLAALNFVFAHLNMQKILPLPTLEGAAMCTT